MPWAWGPASLCSYQWTGDEPGQQPTPVPAIPPTPPWITNADYQWLYQARRNIGAVPWMQIVIIHDDGVTETDITDYVVRGGIDAWSLILPVLEIGSNDYTLPFCTLKIAEGTAETILGLLRASNEEEDEEKAIVQFYQRVIGSNYRDPVQRWRVEEVSVGTGATIKLNGYLTPALEKHLMADGIYRQGRLFYEDTLEITQGSPGDDLSISASGIDINPNYCEIGKWRIEFTSATEFTISGPGVLTDEGSTDEEYTVSGRDYAESPIRIPADSWSGTASEGAVVEFYTTFTFVENRASTGDQYVNPVWGAYILIIKAGFGPEEIAAGGNFPYSEQTSGMSPPDWMYPDDVELGDETTDLGKGETAIESNWWYYYGVGLNHMGKFCCDKEGTTVLSFINSVLSHVHGSIFARGEGMIDILCLAPPYGETQLNTLNDQYGLLEARAPTLKKHREIKALFGYNHATSEFELSWTEPNGSLVFEQEVPGEPTESSRSDIVKLPGFYAQDQVQVISNLETHLLIHYHGASKTTIDTDVLFGCFIADGLGLPYKFETADIPLTVGNPHLSSPYGYNYDPNTFRVLFYMIDWETLGYIFIRYDEWDGFSEDDQWNTEGWPSDEFRYDLGKGYVYGP
jgi:hypothetical protein